MRFLRALSAALLTASLVMAAERVSAQQFPNHPIVMVSPYAAGNATDIVARVVLDQAAQFIGQPFVIENRPGAGGVVGVASVVRADSDGYTLLLSSASMSSAVVLHKSLPYDAIRDLTGVAVLGAQPNVLVTSPTRGFKTLADLVAAAKAKPGELNFASTGIGSSAHIAAELFRLAAGLNFQHVPYHGPNEAFADIIAGRIDFFFLPIASSLSMIQSGKLLPLVVSSPHRAPLLPNVPTIAEAGYPAATYTFWNGISAPAKTPRVVINRLHDDIQKALDVPEVSEKLKRFGVQPMPMSSDEFNKFFAADVAATVKLGKDADIRPTD